MFRGIWLISGLLLVSSLSGRADTLPQAKKAITAIYAQEASEFSKKNPYAMYDHQTVDYIMIPKKGARIDKETIFHNVENLVGIKEMRVTITILNFILKGTKGNIAVVQTKNHLRLTNDDPYTGKTSSIMNDSFQEDLWVKQGNNWLMRQSKEISNSTQASKGK